MNRDTAIALAYHEQTKHSAVSVRAGAHGLDWASWPVPFKIYGALETIPLPKDVVLPMAALDAVAAVHAGDAARTEAAGGLSLPGLARLLYLSNGITRRLRRGGRVHLFRAASCTGALYHVELYVVCGDLPDLPAGVYHYGAHDHALRRLRAGDFRDALRRAAADEVHVAEAAAVIIGTDTFWRNAWKYRSRAYRHSGWDTGVILANLLAVAAALGLPAHVVCGFADEDVNRLIGVRSAKEAATVLVPLGRDTLPGIAAQRGSSVRPGILSHRGGDAGQRVAGRSAPEVATLDLPTAPPSRAEVDYPLIREIHAASSLTAGEVREWRGSPPVRPERPPVGPLFPLAEPAPLSRDTLDAVIKRRGSSRRFTRRAITRDELSTILRRSTRGIPADFLEAAGAGLNELYLIVNAVEGLPPGSYAYRAEDQALEQLREGTFRDAAGYLDLEQALARDAAVNFYYLAALDPVLQRFGNRGYRAAQLEAGLLGGKVYLCAYALGLGATGLTFYDDEVISFFSPHAAGKSAMFLMAVGHPERRPRTS